MNDRQNENQARAHKQNFGILQAHQKTLEQINKDRRKRIQTVDQEILESYTFLEQIKRSTGTSIKYEDIYVTKFPTEIRRVSLLAPPTPHKPSRNSLIRMEVQLQKALAETRFRAKSEEFFKKWEKIFQIDLQLDKLENERNDSNYLYISPSVSRSFMRKPYK